MRTGLFLGALLATMLVGTTALAERNDTDARSSKGRQIKEQVLEKQKEGYGRSSHSNVQQRNENRPQAVRERTRPRGDVYGDQAQRSSNRSRQSEKSGKNYSASGNVNTPSEIRAMLRMINPMFGAYRTSQAAEGTDTYGSASVGVSRTKTGASSNGGGKNYSATSKVNTPSEIRKFLKIINPMKGAYSTSAANDGADSYSYTTASNAQLMRNRNNASVQFKNEKGERSTAQGRTDTASKSKATREKLTSAVKEKIEKAKQAKQQ